MRIRLGRKRTQQTEVATEESSPNSLRKLLAERVSVRQFLKLAAAAGAVGVAELATAPREGEATYTPGSPADTVDTNLTVQGNLVVDQNVGIGTSTPSGRLEVVGTVTNDTLVLIGTDGRGKQSFYAAGPYVAPPATTSAGTWGRVKTATWAAAYTKSWDELRSMDGTWERVATYYWGDATHDLGVNTWDEVATLAS